MLSVQVKAQAAADVEAERHRMQAEAQLAADVQAQVGAALASCAVQPTIAAMLFCNCHSARMH
jgi:hypothetical protein